MGVNENIENIEEHKDCCHKLFKKCDRNMKKFLCQFLETTMFKYFGEIDHGQKKLIELGARPLLLMEDASEIVARIKNVNGFFELIFKHIIKVSGKDVFFLGSQAFTEEQIGGDEAFTQLREKAESSNAKIKIFHMAIHLGEGAHYGIAICEGDDLLIFDSMQLNGKSAYTRAFTLIAEKIFDNEAVTSLVPNQQSVLQFTGGFLRLNASFIEMQNTMSQNHYCYMWAIWYVHIYLTKGRETLEEIITFIGKKQIDPLIVIKRYIWAVINYLYPTSTKLTKLIQKAFYGINNTEARNLCKFFLIHFRYIWDVSREKRFRSFSVIGCNLEIPRNFKSINDCVVFSVKQPIYVEDNFCE